jgi:uncharacterized LabA/DUF88 family protein
VAVFIDYQNAYKTAREVFDLEHAPFVEGQIYPRRLGVLLTDRGRAGDKSRELERVRVYRGEPVAKHSPKAMAACQRQVRYWSSQALVEPWTRPLHYYYRGQDQYGQDIFEPREKGIDVRLAVDMVLGAARNEYDVCVLCSGDTDLIPALEAVIVEGKRCEVMAWRSTACGRFAPRLKVGGQNLWCHWLDDADYQRVHDPADYTVPLPTPPAANP